MDWDNFNSTLSDSAGRMPGDMKVSYDPPPQDPMPAPNGPVEIPPDQFPLNPVPDPMPDVKRTVGRLRLGFSQPVAEAMAIEG